MQNPDNVEGSSRLRFFVFQTKVMRVYQGLHWQWRRGVLDDGLFRGMASLLGDLSKAPGWQEVWKERRHHFDPDFQAFMDAVGKEDSDTALFDQFSVKKE